MIEIKNLNVKFGDKVIYKDFNISFEENKITAILGKSGCGKTTLFNVLNNTIKYSAEIVNNYKEKSMIYSTPRLISTMTVWQNLKFILKDVEFDWALKELDLYQSKDLYPDELSSGMAQRVSLLRGILYPSKILFMDEPFVNLDISLKYKLMNIFLKYWDNKTTLLISHDIDDAIFLASRILIIDNNKIVLDIENDKTQKTKDKIVNKLLLL